MNQLYALIEHHAGLYYNEDSPEIPDSEYDSLVRELSELEADYPQFARKDFLTHRVGGQVSKLFSPVKHEVPMLSLDNVFAPEELSNFFARIKQERDYVCEMKIDGLAVSLVYEDGVFVRGATRGDGSTGEDVTENLRMIESVPKELVNAPAGRVEVRGEVLMTWERFNVINRLCAERGEKVFANPRNAASGTLRQKNSQVVAERGLDIFLYYLVDAEAHGVRTQSAALEWMREHGLPIQEAYSYCETLEDVNAFIAAWQEKRHRLGYITDGVVVKLNDLTIWPKLGATSHAPRWAVAYKYPPEEARTRITGISVSVGRTGVLTPVAVLEPVSVGGSTVQRATLHNAKYIAEKDIRVGDVVFVRKAAEIIPEIVSVETGARTGDEQPFTMPESCPECGAAVTQRESAHVCTNMECPARLRESLRHFASRKGMDIRGLGKVLANELIDSGKVRTLTDIYRMTREDWLSVGLGDKGAQNIMNELEASKSRKLSAFITALGVPHVESTTAEILAGKFGSVETIESASLKQVVRVLSPQVERDAKTVQDFFRKAGNVELLRQKFSELEASGKRPIGALTETLGEISGLNRSTREALAGYFGSLEALSVAGLEEIAVALSPDVDTLMGIACSVSEFLAVGGNVERLRGTSGMTRKSLTEALCVIPGVERGVAQKLARHFGSLEALRAASPEEIAAAISPNVGTLTGIAQSIHEFLADEENVARLSQSSGTTRKSLTEALCVIPGVERGIAQKLARHFGSLEALRAAGPEEIATAISPNVRTLTGIAQSIHEFLADEENVARLSQSSGTTRKSLTEALCVIPGVERGIAQKLSRHFGSLEALRAAGPEEIVTAINPNVGTLTSIAQSVHEFLADKENVARLSQSSGTTRKSLTEALCLIPGVERGVAQKLARHFGTLEALQAATPEEIFSVLDNVPELVIAESIHSFFHNEANIKLIDEFRELGLNLGQIQRKSELDGKIFVFTGALSTMTRSSAAKYVEALGAKFSNTITSATSYLVAGEKTGSKLNKAQKLGITILSEDEFLNLIHFDPQQSPEEIN